eukprot:TRINITY_DN789_c0_g1_i2.p2 TRINITY_DN789_c0_g1~~TRINITY_DN789_c0_g1_i2.p2  ORF type:complete len:218 (-),score=53.67 TRINITY_DN789_c0_g1_i2:55-708(-)
MMNYTDEPQVDLEDGQHHEEGFRKKLGKKVAGKNWTKALQIASLASALGIIACAVAQLLEPSNWLVGVNIGILGLIMFICLCPFPPMWNKLVKRWMPFLETWRGRGLYLILMGAMTTTLNSAPGYIVGIVIVLIGLAHILLRCYFKETLDDLEQTNTEKTLKEGDNPWDLRGAAQEYAYDNRKEIGKAAYENRETIGRVAMENREVIAEVALNANRP